MKTTFIYGLFDPRTDELKYIGKSDNPNVRLLAHISESRNNVGYNTKKEIWIKELLNCGLQPIVKILEECSIENWKSTERLHIQQARENGLDIINIAIGGEGGAIRVGPHTPETIAKIKLSKRNISDITKERLSVSTKKGWPKRKQNGYGIVTLEQRKKISNSLKGRKKPIEVIKNMKIAQRLRRDKEKEGLL